MSRPAIAVTAVLFLLYVIGYVVRWTMPAMGDQVDTFAMLLELALDAVAASVAFRLPRVYRLVGLSFVATGLSAANLDLLTHAFGVELAKTRGTWLELEINLPYFAFFLLALGAIALLLTARRGPSARLPLAGFVAAFIGLTAWKMHPALMGAGYGTQTLLVHEVAMALGGALVGGGLALAALGKGVVERVLGAAYASIAVSAVLFQVSVVSFGALPLDVPIDLTWTLGQFGAIAALLLVPTRRKA